MTLAQVLSHVQARKISFVCNMLSLALTRALLILIFFPSMLFAILIVAANSSLKNLI